MHFVVIYTMRWLLRCMTCSCKRCRVRLLGQLAEQKVLTLLLQVLGNLQVMVLSNQQQLLPYAWTSALAIDFPQTLHLCTGGFLSCMCNMWSVAWSRSQEVPQWGCLHPGQCHPAGSGELHARRREERQCQALRC